jgi:hypothetical protein
MTIHTAPHKFVKIIQDIATAYGMDLTADFNHLRLERTHYQPLVIEKLGSNIISVAHYREMNCDLIPDPDVSFRIYNVKGKDFWLPLEIRQILGEQVVSEFDGEKLVRYSSKGQKNIASFCSMWANNLVAQEWHLNQKPHPDITAKSSYFEPIMS